MAETCNPVGIPLSKESGMQRTMKAIVVESPGGPEVLQIREVPLPEPRTGWVLIAIEAFGLNRAELFTRAGASGPAVRFPRIIGIECVGTVAAAPGSTLVPGQKVAAMMGGMGRAFDGSYAEYAVVPESCVLPIHTDLPWEVFGALPEMFQTANGSLRSALGVKAGGVLLIRGGTSTVGLAAAALARELGLTVVATTRRRERTSTLLQNGAHSVLVDETGRLNGPLRQLFPDGVDYVLELVGTTTLNDSLRMLRQPGGVCCMTGILAGEWQLHGWNPMEHIANGSYLTSYSGEGMSREDLQSIVSAVEAGHMSANLSRVFAFEEIASAHQYMEANLALGKCVVRVNRSA